MIDYPLRRIRWKASCRLIPSRFPPVELYEPIAPVEDWEGLKRIEAMTNPRLRECNGGLGLLLPEDRGRVEQNWLVAPFAYPDPEPSQFSDGSFGVCVVAETLRAALSESVRRREEFLRRTGEGPMRLDMRLLKAPVDAPLYDLTGFTKGDGSNIREIVRELREAKSFGFLCQAPVCAADRIAVILRPTAFGAAVQANHFCYIWNGERISVIYDYSHGDSIDPRELPRLANRDAA